MGSKSDFFENRQCVINNYSRKEMQGWIDKMLDYLGGEIWLNKSQNVDHPIVRLWNRKDYMATNELLSFAYAVSIMDRVDSKWTAKTMKVAAGKNFNNVHGAIFEIIALSIFQDSDCEVIPTSMGNPGIDGTICLNNGTEVNLSIKYYGISKAELDFQKQMDEIYNHIGNMLRASKCLSADVVIDMKKYIDSFSEKKILIKQVADLFDKYGERSGCEQVCSETNLAICYLRPIQNQNLSGAVKSYKLLAVSPMHKNEYKNLRDKIDDACCNLKKHAPGRQNESKKTLFNGILIHIHEDADIDAYQEEMQRYLEENNGNKDFPIDFIVLYQVCVACEEKAEHYYIYHVIKPAVLPHSIINGSTSNTLSLPVISFFIGKIGPDSSKRALLSNDVVLSELTDVYHYQKGEIYEKSREYSESQLYGEVKMLAPGVRVSPVFRLRDKNVIPKIITFENEHMEIL